MTTPPIPQAMVDALAEQLAWEWTADDIECDRPHPWKSPPVPKSLEENWRERYRAAARRLLGAALGVCDVREEWGNRFWLDGAEADTWDQWTADQEFAERRVKYHTAQRAFSDDWRGNARLIRRLVVATPAEQVDTEGAPK